MKPRQLHMSAALLVALALSACTADQVPGFLRTADGDATPPVQETATEAPFHAIAPGVWDGKPSLGGVWVAAEDVEHPRKVRITNRANGRSVRGRLYGLEPGRMEEGFLVSSDAARKLGMKAERTVQLEVASLDWRPVQPAPAPVPAADDAAGRGPASTEAGGAAKAGAMIAGTTLPQESRPAPRPQAAPLAVPSPGPGKTAAAPRPRPAAGTPATAAHPDGAPAAQPGNAPMGSITLIQAAIFGSRANAERARALVEARGLPARVAEASAGSHRYWRLLVGPVAAERVSDILQALAGLGFTGAHPVKE